MTTIERIVKDYNKTGRVAFIYPKLKKISLNGGKQQSYSDAMKAMLEILNKK